MNINLAGTVGAVGGGTALGGITGNNVTLNVGDTIGGVTYLGGTNVTAKTSATVTASSLQNNAIDIVALGTSTALAVTYTGGILNDTVTVTGVTNNTSISVAGGFDIGTNTLALDGGLATAAQALTITATGYDIATITGGDAVDTVVGAAGADVFVVTLATDFDAGESFTGGTGTDTLFLDEAAVYDLTNIAAAKDNLVTEAAVEQLIVTHTAVTLDEAISGTALKINTDGAVTLAMTVTMVGTTFDASSFTFTAMATATSAATETALAAGNDSFQITGTTGGDVITTSLLGDTVFVATTGAADSDTMTGGAGTDTLNLTGANHAFATDSQLSAFENIALVSTASVDLTGQTEAFAITGSNGINTITVGANTTTISGGATATDAINYSVAGATVITGDATTVTVTGTTGVDTFTNTNNGAATATLGGGIDIFTGGTAVDTIVIGTTAASADIIETFTSTADRVDLTTVLLNNSSAALVDSGSLAGAATIDAAIAISAVASQFIFSNAAFELDLTSVTDSSGMTTGEIASITTAARAALNATTKTNLDSTFLATETVIFVLDDSSDTSSAVFSFNNSTATGTAVDDGELVLIAVVDANAIMANGDIIA